MQGLIRSIASAGLLASACSPVDPFEPEAAATPAPSPSIATKGCETTDWRTAGLGEALQGRDAEEGLALIESCLGTAEAAGRLAAQSDFSDGFAQGLAIYCGPENAIWLGRTRAEPTLDCPPDLQPSFDVAYREGLSQADTAWRYGRPLPSIGGWVSVGRDVYGGIGVRF